jgi:hypothetical protein
VFGATGNYGAEDLSSEDFLGWFGGTAAVRRSGEASFGENASDGERDGLGSGTYALTQNRWRGRCERCHAGSDQGSFLMSMMRDFFSSLTRKWIRSPALRPFIMAGSGTLKGISILPMK